MKTRRWKTERSRRASILCPIFAAALTLLLLSACPRLAAQTLRGFGTVQAARLPDGQGMHFTCDSAAHATLLIHKLAHDMAASATVPSRWTRVQIAGQAVPVLVRPGLGAYLVLAHGHDAYCFTAPLAAAQGEDGLAAAFASAAPLVPGAQLYDASYVYPFYLDKWSDKGIGTWYTPYDPFDDDPHGLKDIVNPHFQYLTQNGLTAHLMDGSVPESEHFVRKYNRPYHIARWLEWDNDIARLDPFDLALPGSQFTSFWNYYGQISNGGATLQQYRNWDFQNVMGQYVNDPNLMDWDEPHGEFSESSGQSQGDTSESNRQRFVHWLQTDRGYTLAALGQAWHHDPHFFATWSQVPLPWDYSLFGFDKDSVMADHTWRLHNADLQPGTGSRIRKEQV